MLITLGVGTLWGPAQIAGGQPAEVGLSDFGYDTAPRHELRPLLTILHRFADVPFSSDHDAEFYEDLLFSSSLIGSVAGGGSFFAENSDREFFFENEGVIGPYVRPDDPATAGMDESEFECGVGFDGCSDQTKEAFGLANRRELGHAIRSADEDFNFTPYDTRAPLGVITNDELTILRILAIALGDARTTTDSAWRAPIRGTDPVKGAGYHFAATLGRVFTPEFPPRTTASYVPLYAWRSPLRGDYRLTSDPAWAGAPGDTMPPDYQFVRLEGYAYGRGSPGFLLPLNSYYSPSRADYFTGTEPPLPGDGRPNDYTLVRTEGHIVPAGEGAPLEYVDLNLWYSEGEIGQGGGLRGTEPLCVPVSDPRPTGGSLCVAAGVPGGGEAVGAATLAHELTHSLGIYWEAYGWNSKNSPYTTMGGTILDPRDDRSIWDLDPYAKMFFGWLEPEILTVDQAGCFDLQAAEYQETSSPSPRAYIVYDPDRGTDEFFILEHRLPAELTYDGDPWFTGTRAMPDQGLALWIVKKDPVTNEIFGIDAYDRLGGDPEDPSMYLLPPPPGTPGKPSRMNGLWNAVDGEAEPMWLDGTPAGFTVEVASDTTRALDIELEMNGASSSGEFCFLPPEPPQVPAGTLPSLDERPCGPQGFPPAHVCRVKTPDVIAENLVPALVEPGDRFDIDWTVRARRAVKRLVIIMRLPLSRPLGNGPDRLVFKNLGKGEEKAGSLRFRSPTDACGFPYPPNGEFFTVQDDGDVIARLEPYLQCAVDLGGESMEPPITPSPNPPPPPPDPTPTCGPNGCPPPCPPQQCPPKP